jgi:hypothetical protein
MSCTTRPRSIATRSGGNSWQIVTPRSATDPRREHLILRLRRRIRARIGAGGHIDVIDFTDEARDAYIAGTRGRHGQLATWRYEYTLQMPPESYDVMAVSLAPAF